MFTIAGGIRVSAILLISIGAMAYKSEYFRYGKDFELTVTSVRSIAPERKVGFGKSMVLYAVNAYSGATNYVLYCTRTSPQQGHVYTSNESYVSGDYTDLKVWPVEKKSLDLPDGESKRGRLYRGIDIHDVKDKQPKDLFCDVYSQTERK